MSRAAKWWATMLAAWQTHAVYRVNFVLLVIGPALVFFFVKVSLWSSIYAQGGGASIAGYDRDAMLAYQCYVLVVVLLAQGYQSVPLSEDIRLGRITSHLLYPFPFLEAHAARWLAFQLLQLCVALLLIGLAVATGFLPVPAPAPLATGLAFTVLVAALWFTFTSAIGLLAFWLEETWVVRVILRNLAVFLSGSVLPLELYPAWLRELLFYTPFPYLTWVPARMLAGEYPDVGGAALVTIGWVVAGVLLCRLVWRRGIGLYSAAGM